MIGTFDDYLDRVRRKKNEAEIEDEESFSEEDIEDNEEMEDGENFDDDYVK